MKSSVNIKQIELIAMQALLPGLTYAMERSVEQLNSARNTLGLPSIGISSVTGEVPVQTEIHVPVDYVDKPERKKRSTSPATKRRMRELQQYRRRIMVEAGMDKGRMPSKAEIAEAEAIVARKNKRKVK